MKIYEDEEYAPDKECTLCKKTGHARYRREWDLFVCDTCWYHRNDTNSFIEISKDKMTDEEFLELFNNAKRIIK